MANNAFAGNVMFAQANQAYHNQNYVEAANAYMQIVKEGFTDGAVYYNAGNSFYKLNKNGWAIWCYLKALQYNPGNKNIQENIKLAQNKLSIIQPPKNYFNFKTGLKKIAQLHSLNNWALGALIAFALALIFYSWRNFFNAPAFLIAIRKLCWVIFFIYASGALLSYYFENFFINAIVVNNTVAYFNSTEQGIGNQPILEGSPIIIKEFKKGLPDRYKVELNSCEEVWLNADAIRKL